MFNKFRNVILLADTTALEFFLAVYSFCWGLWLEFLRPPTLSAYGIIIENAGGVSLWGVLAILGGTIHIYALIVGDKLARLYSSMAGAMYFVAVAYLTANAHTRLYLPFANALVALALLWVTTHRKAVS